MTSPSARGSSTPTLWGLMAEFDDPHTLVEAAESAKQAGYRMMDAYSPFPIEGLDEAIGFHKSRISLVVLLGGLVGLFGGIGLQVWCAAIDYPINVGGRPFISLPSFVPITFECTVLVASLSAAFGMLILNGLPMMYHPVFNVPRFAMASRDRFFLCIEAKDSAFELKKTTDFLQGLAPKGVYEVEP
jgi:Protein of unknown function (DUF3341)